MNLSSSCVYLFASVVLQVKAPENERTIKQVVSCQLTASLEQAKSLDRCNAGTDGIIPSRMHTPLGPFALHSKIKLIRVALLGLTPQILQTGTGNVTNVPFLRKVSQQSYWCVPGSRSPFCESLLRAAGNLSSFLAGQTFVYHSCSVLAILYAIRTITAQVYLSGKQRHLRLGPLLVRLAFDSILQR